MAKTKVTIPQLKGWKKQTKKFAMITAYDALLAAVIDKTPIETILVGDSMGMVVYGYDSTVPVTMEQIVQLPQPNQRAVEHGHSRAQPDCHPRRVGSHHAAAQNRHPARQYSRHPAQQDATAALGFF